MSRPPTTFVDALRAVAEQFGDHGVRVYDKPGESSVLSYRELDIRGRQIATGLAEHGLGPGDVVALAFQPGLEFVEATYGAYYAGLALALVPVSGFGPGDDGITRLAAFVESSGARLVLTHASVADALGGLPAMREHPAIGGVPVTTIAEAADRGDADAWVEPDIDAETLVGLVFTSGSTGVPKGVILTHGGFLGQVTQLLEVTGTTAESTYVGWAPHHHAMGFAFLMMGACSGAEAIVLPTAQFQRRPVYWLQLMSEHRATVSVAGNFAFDLCTQLATDEQISELDLSNITSLVTGSEAVRMDTVRRFVQRFAPAGVQESMIAPAMGMTETMLMSIKRPGEQLQVLRVDPRALETGWLKVSDDEQAAELVSCGPPAPVSEVVIVDASGDLAVDGQIGEIWVAGPGVAQGYWRNPEATAEVFGAKLDGDDRDYLRSGDLGAILDGELYVTGRVKDLIIVRGRNIYPQDLEAVAGRLVPAVISGAAFELDGHPSDVGIVLELDSEKLADAGADIASLSEQVRSTLVKTFSLPSLGVALIREGSLPRTPGGKVQRSLTRAKLERGELDLLHVAGVALPDDQLRPDPTPVS